MPTLLRPQIILQPLLAAVLLLTNAFAQNPDVVSPASPGFGERTITSGFAQKATLENLGFDPAYKLSLPRPVQDKNFYLLSLFQRNQEVRRLLSKNRKLSSLAAGKLLALKQAENCKDVRCFDELIRLDGLMVEEVATELNTLANQPAFKRLAKTDLRPAGVFIKYSARSDAEMLVGAWQDAAAGLNRILTVYCLGQDPRYPAIDKVSFDVSTDAYRDLLKTKIAAVRFSSSPLFFEPSLNFALKLLEINRRDEAARYEPLEQRANQAAIQNLKHIRWSDYPYSFILVLGSGPQDLTTPLSPIGAKRTDVGAQLFLQHKAPLIIVSGGHVHPMQTPYCEAIEMKKYLMDKYRIPAARILVDPHARHTTTNFRNAARLAFRYRIPTSLAMVTSSESHITSSISDDFRTRCLTELGYFPVEFIKRLSPVAAEFKPSIASLFFDAGDPLDP